MAATLKTYLVQCPDPDCAEEFTIDRDPAELAKGDGDLIPCPTCLEEWEWDYTAASPEYAEDELFLSAGDDEADDEAEDMDLTGFDDEDDEEDDYE